MEHYSWHETVERCETLHHCPECKFVDLPDTEMPCKLCKAEKCFWECPDPR